MRRGAWADDLPALYAASTRGVIRARTLVQLGVPERTVYTRCRDGRPWRRLLPGIIQLSNGSPTQDQKVIAALLFAGQGAVVTGIEACRRHGMHRLPRSDGEIHILIPHDCHVRSFGFVHIERSRRMPDALIRDGVPIAPVARASIDAARRLRRRGDIAELLSDPVQQRMCTIEALNTELDDCSRRGTAMPRIVLAGVSVGIRSAAELEARRVWASTNLPEPWWNARIYTLDGTFIGIADAWFDEVAMAWEIDSTEWHLSPKDHTRSIAKAGAYAAAGIIHLPNKPSELLTAKSSVRRQLIATYAQAAARPRPAVVAVRV